MTFKTWQLLIAVIYVLFAVSFLITLLAREEAKNIRYWSQFEVCQLERIDGAIRLPNGSYYLFSGLSFWELFGRLGVVEKSPKPIQEFWPGVTGSIQFAFENNGRRYLVEGTENETDSQQRIFQIYTKIGSEELLLILLPIQNLPQLSIPYIECFIRDKKSCLFVPSESYWKPTDHSFIVFRRYQKRWAKMTLNRFPMDETEVIEERGQKRLSGSKRVPGSREQGPNRIPAWVLRQHANIPMQFDSYVPNFSYNGALGPSDMTLFFSGEKYCLRSSRAWSDLGSTDCNWRFHRRLLCPVPKDFGNRQVEQALSFGLLTFLLILLAKLIRSCIYLKM